MKYSVMTIMVMMLLLMLAGCGQQIDMEGIPTVNPEAISDHERAHNEYSEDITISPEYLEFTSLEEFLDARKIASEGVEEIDMVEERMGLASLERLYLPTGIPDSYEVFSVAIDTVNVSFLLMPREYLSTEHEKTNAIIDRQYFAFSYMREDFEAPMSGILEQFGATEAELVDGKYLFVDPNIVFWGYDGKIMCMQFPLPPGTVATDIEDMMSLSADNIAQSLNLSDRGSLTRFLTLEIVDFRG